MSSQLSIHCCWSGPWNVLILSKIWVFVYCGILLLESSGSQELPKRARNILSSELSDSIFCSLSTLSLSHTYTYTNTYMHIFTPARTQTRRRYCVTIFSHAGVSLPHDNCEFNWCCHMVCNGVSSDCRGSVKETQIFLQEKRRLSRAGIKKKTPLSD